MLNKIRQWRLTEKQRTVALLLLLAFAVGFIIWTNSNYSNNFVDSF